MEREVELVPTVAVPLPEPLVVKYAQPPIAAMAATSSAASSMIRLFVTNRISDTAFS